MKSKNVSIIVAAAVIIAICLLFSWVQYGGDHGQQQDDGSFEGTWMPVYSYTPGGETPVAPGDLTVTADGAVLVCTNGETATEYRMVQERLYQTDDGYSVLYLEDGVLYSMTYAEDGGFSYAAYSRDSHATLPSDPMDLSGTTYGIQLVAGGTQAEGVLTIDSHSFHVIRGTLTYGETSVSFTGFVMTLDSVYVQGQGQLGEDVGEFACVITDGRAYVDALIGDTLITGQPVQN